MMSTKRVFGFKKKKEEVEYDYFSLDRAAGETAVAGLDSF